jgi:hypothetical protein
MKQVVPAMRLKLLLAISCSLGCLVFSAAAQDSDKKKDKSAAKRETVAKPMTDKQRRQRQERLRKNWRPV